MGEVPLILGEVLADQVDAHERQAAALQLRADGGADLAGGGHAIDGAHGLAVDQQEALVRHLGRPE